MSRAIGDYVHARGENYRLYGTGYKSHEGGSFEASVQQAHQEAYSHIQKTQQTTQTEKLSRFLTALVYHKDIGYQGDSLSISPQQIEELENQFLQLVEAKFPTLQANLNNLTFESAIKGGGVNSNTLNTGTSKGVEKKTLESARANLDKIIQNIGKLQGKGAGAQLQAMYAEAQALSSRMDSLISAADGRAAGAFISSTRSGGEDNDLLQKYNDLIKSIQAPTKEQMGTLAEAYFAFMLQAAAGIVDIAVDELFDVFVTGAKSSTNVIRNIRTDVGATLAMKMNTSITKTGKQKVASGNQMQWQWDDKTGTITWSGGAQGTVDIALNFPEDSALAQEFGVNKLNGSVKNYQSIDGFMNYKTGEQEGVHIVSGYPLLSALMLYNTNFSNHYLNLIAAHEDGINFNVPEEATETIKKGIAVRALSGARDVDNISNNALSDIFIVNDRSAQMVRVYSTKDLIDRIWGDVDRYASVKGMPAGRIPMTWYGDSPDQGSAEVRIANLLANVHSFKISMALKPSTF